jgi:ketosteroid isomerase-like protein
LEKNLESIEREIENMVNTETKAWDTQDAELLVSIFHQDMVWPWPRTALSHNPMDWVITWGRYDYKRWKDSWQELFDTHRLVHNKREIKKIEVSIERDGAFVVVDIDTLWLSHEGVENHWKGRVCKVYTKVDDEWKFIMQTGVLDYSDIPTP